MRRAHPAGCSFGHGGHGLLLAPYRDLINSKTPVDPHCGATVGMLAGITCAGALAFKRYDVAGTVGAAVGGGLVAQGLGFLAGAIVAFVATGLSETANAYRWYVGTPTHSGNNLGTCAILVPAVQVVAGLAGAGTAGYITRKKLRDTTVAETSNV